MVNAVQHPKLEDIYRNIVGWVEKNFVKAILQFHVAKDEFKFHRVLKISKVWKENDCWVVEATVEYDLGGYQARTITFQIDSEGKILGYNLHEPIIRG